MSIIGIVLESWKLSIFKKELDGDGFTYEQVDNCPLKDETTLKVETNDIPKLTNTVKRAMLKARNSKMN